MTEPGNAIHVEQAKASGKPSIRAKALAVTVATILVGGTWTLANAIGTTGDGLRGRVRDVEIRAAVQGQQLEYLVDEVRKIGERVGSEPAPPPTLKTATKAEEMRR